MPSMSAYLAAFALTVLIETPVYVLAVVVLARIATVSADGTTAAAPTGWVRRNGAVDGFVTSLVANVTTHPFAFLVVGPLLVAAVGGVVAVIVIEVAVMAVETAIVYRRHDDMAFALVTAATANALSFGIGYLLML